MMPVRLDEPRGLHPRQPDAPNGVLRAQRRRRRRGRTGSGASGRWSSSPDCGVIAFTSPGRLPGATGTIFRAARPPRQQLRVTPAGVCFTGSPSPFRATRKTASVCSTSTPTAGSSATPSGSARWVPRTASGSRAEGTTRRTAPGPRWCPPSRTATHAGTPPRPARPRVSLACRRRG